MIKDLLHKERSGISFEVFPPKKDEDFVSAFDTMRALSALNPDFISVTYGAGGSKSKKTLEIASFIQNELHTEVLAHLTCVGNKKEDILSVTEGLASQGIFQVLALRGDRPRDMSDEQFASREFF